MTNIRIGIVGAGNSAQAIAHGWAAPVLCTDAGSGRAAALVAQVGGEVAPDNATLADVADVVVLCHKPAQLTTVAAQLGGRAKAVVSLLAGVSLRDLRETFPDTPVLRYLVNLPVRVRQGVVCAPPAQAAPTKLEASIDARFAELGTFLRIEEELFPVVSTLSGVGPAYLALFVEAQIDVAVRHGMDATRAARLAVCNLAGTAELLDTFDRDPVRLRRAVTSPGGLTSSGLAALEKAGLRAALLAAGEAVVARYSC